MTDVLRALARFEWRGRQYPISSRSVSFAHAAAKHPIQYRNGRFVEPTGAENLVLSYTFPMRQDIAKGPYKNLFTEGLPVLFRDCRNREPGKLLDPIYGELTCVPQTYNDESDVNRRDGTDIRVEFEHAPEFDEEELEPEVVSLSGIKTEAGQLDEDLKAAPGFEQFIAENAETDVLSAIAGVGAQIDRQQNKVAAGLDDVAFRAEKIEKQADKLENPQNWQVRRSARRVREDAIRLKKRGENPAERIITVIRRFQTTVTAEAAKDGMTVQELLKLNPSLATSPLILPGTVIRIVRK